MTKRHITRSVGLGITIFLAAAPALSWSASGESQLQCTGTIGGYAHSLNLTLVNDNVVGIEYKSVNTETASDCWVSAKSENQDDSNRSSWIIWPHVAIVQLLGEANQVFPAEQTHLVVIQTGNEYKVMLQPGVAGNYCAPWRTYIAPVAVLTRGRANCKLTDERQK